MTKTKAITICKWITGDMYLGQTAFYLTLLTNGKYAVSEASAMAMHGYERLGLYAEFTQAVKVFGHCVAGMSK